MAIDQRTPAVTIGGSQKWRSKSLIDAMALVGFDPSVAGDEWALIATDLHCYYEGGTGVATAFDPRTVAECAVLAATPPEACLILGDVLTGFVGSFGAPADTVDGTLEATAADAALACFSDLADTYLILGNHDTPPEEDPLGTFMLANCPEHFTGLNHAVTIGGVRFVLLSTSHDGALIDGQTTFLGTELAGLTAGQECVIGTHQPGGGRAYDFHCLGAIKSTVESAVITNPLWQICGHDHRFGQSNCYAMGNTTLAQQKIGAGGGAWLTFSDGTHPALCAFACRGGKVVARFAWDGKERFWHVLPSFNRSSPVPVAGQLDGVSGLTVLSQYLEGLYDRTGRFNNAASGLTYRITGTWLAYCYDIRVNFPIPDGATKFWYVTTAKPTTLSVSDDGATWQAITPIPDLSSGAIIFDIPAGLLSADFLHVKVTTGGHHISAWGFAS